jgi:FkbM family methyltransferase
MAEGHPPQARPRAAGYVRASTAEAQGESMAPRDQRRRIEEHVAERGWDLLGVWEDSGPFAGSRPALRELLEKLPEIGAVVVAGIDRLGNLARPVVAQLANEGVVLVALDDDLDTGTPGTTTAHKLVAALDRVEDRTRWLREGWRPQAMAARGFMPATVIDVGAARGTPLLYRSFPDAYHVLIEPLREFEQELEQLTRTWRGEYLLTAVGAKDGTATLHVRPECLLMSSFNETTNLPPGGENGIVEREVPVTTLDRLLEERHWEPPFGLKIDTEGFEHRVIEGAATLLEETQFVIAEVSVARRFEGSYTFAEFVAQMDDARFELDDVIGVDKTATGGVAYMDCVFKKAD